MMAITDRGPPPLGLSFDRGRMRARVTLFCMGFLVWFAVGASAEHFPDNATYEAFCNGLWNDGPSMIGFVDINLGNDRCSHAHQLVVVYKTSVVVVVMSNTLKHNAIIKMKPTDSEPYYKINRTDFELDPKPGSMVLKGDSGVVFFFRGAKSKFLWLTYEGCKLRAYNGGGTDIEDPTVEIAEGWIPLSTVSTSDGIAMSSTNLCFRPLTYNSIGNPYSVKVSGNETCPDKPKYFTQSGFDEGSKGVFFTAKYVYRYERTDGKLTVQKPEMRKNYFRCPDMKDGDKGQDYDGGSEEEAKATTKQPGVSGGSDNPEESSPWPYIIAGVCIFVVVVFIVGAVIYFKGGGKASGSGKGSGKGGDGEKSIKGGKSVKSVKGDKSSKSIKDGKSSKSVKGGKSSKSVKDGKSTGSSTSGKSSKSATDKSASKKK